MSRYTHHPKRTKDCVFCKFWIGDAQMKYVNSNSGYEFQASARGRCTKRNGAATTACHTCSNYVPGPDSEKLL